MTKTKATVKETKNLVKEKINEEKDEIKPKSQTELDVLTIGDLKEQLQLLERSVNSRENRHTLRVLRSLPKMRTCLNANVLTKFIKLYYNNRLQNDEASKTDLLQFIEEQPMETDVSVAKTKSGKITRLPESEVYIMLLLLIYLIDNKLYENGIQLANKLLNRLVKENRRSLDPLAARCYFYYSRVYELVGQLADVRSVLHARLRTASLVHDVDTQATLLNLLLRNYMNYNLIDQAEKLSSKSTFPEVASNNEWARYLYYTGRIKAVQLEYSDARKTLVTALRKAPQTLALGFRQAVTKLVIVVELLLGEIPERAQFKTNDMCKTLLPYFHLTQGLFN